MCAPVLQLETTLELMKTSLACCSFQHGTPHFACCLQTRCAQLKKLNGGMLVQCGHHHMSPVRKGVYAPDAGLAGLADERDALDKDAAVWDAQRLLLVTMHSCSSAACSFCRLPGAQMTAPVRCS